MIAVGIGSAHPDRATMLRWVLSWSAVPVFCRHNRFTADCPICSKGTVLESGAKRSRSRVQSGSTAASGSTRRRVAAATAPARGPHGSAGPYEDGEGVRYLVRLERVPGGLRLGEWAGSQLRRRAPVLARADLRALVGGLQGAISERDHGALTDSLTAGAGDVLPDPVGVSRGRAGDLKDELRVEPLTDGHLRIARWVMRPGTGWELQQAPPMLPAARYAAALADAARKGALAEPPPG